MAVLSILNAALNETPHTIAFSGLCKRVRFRKSNCQRCVQICPENVISLEPGPAINSGCTDCGLCERVCPTEAFRNPLYTDLSLLNRARSFPERKKLVIHCERTEGESKYSFSVPCLGRVSENVVLGAAVSGFEEIGFIKGICSTCPLKKGERLFVNSITTARVLLESLGLEKFPVTLVEMGKREERILSRREMFSSISGEVKRKASSYIASKGKGLAKPPETQVGQRPSPKRRLLRKLFEIRPPKGLTMVKHGPEIPWGKIRINEQTCNVCGTCLALCPTGAISKKLEKGCQLLYFNSSLCTNCSLCKEACPKHAINFEVNLSVPDILDDEAKVIARIELIPCIVCGEMITAEKGNRCFTCQKRQVRPMHVSV